MKILNGIDIVNNNRIRKMLDKSSQTINDIFSPLEREYCFQKKRPEQSLGVRFAAKEALIKAIDGHILEYDLKTIEVFNHSSGKPEMVIKNNQISDKIKSLLNKENFEIALTLSHEKDFSIAHLIIY